jgi:hypothetical protein
MVVVMMRLIVDARVSEVGQGSYVGEGVSVREIVATGSGQIL